MSERHSAHVCVNGMKGILDKDLEQLSSHLPNLQRLDLSWCNLSLRCIRAVASNFPNLKGLNLSNSHTLSLSLHVLWQILSDMKLTHLSIECCVISSVAIVFG